MNSNTLSIMLSSRNKIRHTAVTRTTTPACPRSVSISISIMIGGQIRSGLSGRNGSSAGIQENSQ
mgnify:CR=1 FL=1